MKSALLFAAVAGIALLAAPSAAQAQWGPQGYYYGWGNGYLNSMSWQVPTYQYAQPPYFAVHPPVYYSPTIIRRPYGTSPYALPGIHQLGVKYSPPIFEEPAAAQPQLIINPFVDGAANWSPPSTAGSVQAAIEAERAPVPPAAGRDILPPPQ
jgi:hypothetical protein